MPSSAFIPKLLNIFYDLLYHQFAWSYNLVAWLVSAGQWTRWVSGVVPYLVEGKILELGHGPGHLQKIANKNKIDIFGVDLSPQMGKICKSMLLREQHEPKLVTAKGENPPFMSDCFSTVVATFPAKYILKSSTLEEIYRILLPGGKFVMLPMAQITGRSLFQRFAAFLNIITGQSPSFEQHAIGFGISMLRSAGFKAEIRQVYLENSEVFIFVGTK